MRFVVGGEEFRISFHRDFPEVRFFDPTVVKEIDKNTFVPDGDIKIVGGRPVIVGDYVTRKSTYPSTTVTVWKGNDVFRTDTVKSHHTDKITQEQGRILALRKISLTLDKEFKRAMWEAYVKRPKGQPKAKPKVQPNEQTPKTVL